MCDHSNYRYIKAVFDATSIYTFCEHLETYQIIGFMHNNLWSTEIIIKIVIVDLFLLQILSLIATVLSCVFYLLEKVFSSFQFVASFGMYITKSIID